MLNDESLFTQNTDSRRTATFSFKASHELISKKALEDHIDLVHNITTEKDTRTFDTFQDFKLWKESIEKQTSSLYVKNTGSKSGKTGGKITYFYCHRNGFYNARGDMKRNMKIAGSNKINGNCPSKMKVYEDIESKVTVEFTKTHVGHGIDLGRMKITREEKEEIAEKLENKIPVEAILDDIRNSINQKLRKNSFNNTARYKKYLRGIQYKL
ncbi:uncharacterized protein TNCV_4239451 [Trichonephila clavipes]|nr:uncharacterized protein TNCV_4239451 [Trichonephila clavipes]